MWIDNSEVHWKVLWLSLFLIAGRQKNRDERTWDSIEGISQEAAACRWLLVLHFMQMKTCSSSLLFSHSFSLHLFSSVSEDVNERRLFCKHVGCKNVYFFWLKHRQSINHRKRPRWSFLRSVHHLSLLLSFETSAVATVTMILHFFSFFKKRSSFFTRDYEERALSGFYWFENYSHLYPGNDVVVVVRPRMHAVSYRSLIISTEMTIAFVGKEMRQQGVFSENYNRLWLRLPLPSLVLARERERDRIVT